MTSKTQTQLVETKIDTAIWKTVWKFLKKKKLPRDPIISLLDITSLVRYLPTMFNIAEFTMAKMPRYSVKTA
jgi:hypothetical protein